jgi:saccharopine dehydrogenase-like NADP-dependent oxidoreductase
MAVTYIILEEANGSANVEFIDSETQLSQIRNINTLGATEEEKLQRFEDHLRTFSYRVNIGMIKDPEQQTSETTP